MNPRFILLALVLVLAACQATGPAGNRLSYRFQWLAYLQGDDIRRTCDPSAGDRVRLIYNADFNRQTRTFDLFIDNGGAGTLDTRRWVSSATFVATFGSLNSVMTPESGQARLTREQVRELTDSFAASGFPGPVPVGTRLRSDEFFWAALACVDGVFAVQVWRGEALRNVRFAGLLEGLDPIGRPLPVASTAELPPFGSVVARNRRDGDESNLYYEVEVGADFLRAWWRT